MNDKYKILCDTLFPDIETVFSSIKRLFGEHLTARRFPNGSCNRAEKMSFL